MRRDHKLHEMSYPLRCTRDVDSTCRYVIAPLQHSIHSCSTLTPRLHMHSAWAIGSQTKHVQICGGIIVFTLPKCESFPVAFNIRDVMPSRNMFLILSTDKPKVGVWTLRNNEEICLPETHKTRNKLYMFEPVGNHGCRLNADGTKREDEPNNSGTSTNNFQAAPNVGNPLPKQFRLSAHHR